MKTTQVKAKDLKAGMTIINRSTGETREVLTNPQPCKAPGYVRAETTGFEPVNCPADQIFHVG